ncbi:MAG: hypothetical protein HUJ63_09960 [Enterococcus sp.]|nr:hypothetical protein [Enterococcus sp.]
MDDYMESVKAIGVRPRENVQRWFVNDVDYPALKRIAVEGNAVNRARANRILALDAEILLSVYESRLEPAEPPKKTYKVEFDVQRSGVHSITVEAADYEEAKRLAASAVDAIDDEDLDEMATEVLGTNVVDVYAVDKDGRDASGDDMHERDGEAG